MKQKYSKWVVGAASAALVASAIVPAASAASFTDIEKSDHKDAILALADAKIVAGYPDGTFKPNAVVTRGNVTKFLGKWLVSENYEIPADYETEARFTDLPTTTPDKELLQYAALVKDAGVFKGSNNKLMHTNNMSREQMAVVLVRAIKTVYNVDLVAEYKEAGFKSTITDLEKATAAENREAIIALEYAELTNVKQFNPKNTLTRGQFASFLSRAIDNVGEEVLTVKEAKVVDATTLEVTLSDDSKHTVKLETALPENKETKVDFEIDGKSYSAVVTYEVPEVKVESVDAINAKTLEVKFNTPVEDTTKATIELLRGTFKQNVTLAWADDKKSVQLVGASNFQPADYTVKISGLSEEVLTGSVKIEAQKVSSIEILDEVAVASQKVGANGTFDDGTTATVGYVVKDQYGTDITKSTTLKTNDDTNIKLNASKGLITLETALVKGKKVDDLVPVVLVDTNTGKSVTKTLKLSATATVSSIAVTGIFNAKGEEVALNDKSKASDAFIVLDLKDQYGKEITDKSKATGLIINNTNPFNLEIDDSAVESVKIGEKDKLVIKITDIKKAGNTDVLIVSTTNGQSAKYTVQVAETTTTEAISVSQPEIAVAGEDTLVPVTVTDKTGNVITDKKLLASADKGIKVGGETVKEAELEVKDGQVYYKKNFDKEGTQALVFQTSSFKVATITVDVKAAAVPTVVRGFKSPLVVVTGKPVTIDTKKHLVIEDQYGRVMKDSTAAVKVSADAESKVVSVDADNKVTGLKNGTETLKIELVQPNEKIDSSVEVKVHVTDGKEYTSYEVKELGLVDAKADTPLTVYGVLSTGGKVELAQGDDYTAVTNVEGVEVTDGKLGLAKKSEEDLKNFFTVDGKTVTEREVKVTFTLNSDGSTVERTYKLSQAPAKVQDFFFTTAEVTEEYAKAKAITEAIVTGGVYTIGTEIVKGDATTALNVATVDQYGTTKIEAAAGTVTIVPSKSSDVTITKNGTADAKVELAQGVEETKLTVKVTVGSATKELQVTLKAQ